VMTSSQWSSPDTPPHAFWRTNEMELPRP
jgi:hypothetical protein